MGIPALKPPPATIGSSSVDRIVIQGGLPLTGEVAISGAKNAALPALFATLLARGTCRLKNVPHLRDVSTTLTLLRQVGCEITLTDTHSVEITSDFVHDFTAPYELVSTMRASIMVLGPLLSRFGEAVVSLPGGCAIGARPVNLHLEGLKAMGADIRLEHGYIHAKAKRLKGARITLDLPTVTGTENLMMAAVLAKGTTVLENAAREPEVVDLAEFLIRMGAKIHGAGSDCITIEGVDELIGVEHTILPDRIETGTFMTAVAAVGGAITIRGGRLAHCDSLAQKLMKMGVTIEEDETGAIHLVRSGPLEVTRVQTQPFPGFPTDMQAQMMVVATQAKGTSVVTETIFENRFMHVLELQRMGANIVLDGNTAVVTGSQLAGAPVMATDLRASASLVLAGLVAEGETTISRVYHIDRGYERIEEKFTGLGAAIRRDSPV